MQRPQQNRARPQQQQMQQQHQMPFAEFPPLFWPPGMPILGPYGVPLQLVPFPGPDVLLLHPPIPLIAPPFRPANPYMRAPIGRPPPPPPPGANFHRQQAQKRPRDNNSNQAQHGPAGAEQQQQGAINTMVPTPLNKCESPWQFIPA